MTTIRLTTAQAIVRWLLAQRTEIDGDEVPIFAGVFAIFGHGNVTSLGEALEPVQDRLPTYRGHNEQSMALAADRVRQGDARPADHDRDVVDRAWLDQHGDRRGRRPRQPAAGPAPVGRHVPAPDRRPRPPAGRALRRPDDHGRRRIQAGEPLLGPHHQARPDRPVAAAGPRRDARSGDARTGVLRAAPGRPGRGVRLPCPLLRADASTTSGGRAPIRATSRRRPR